jgi:hypothetical protein
MLSMLCIVALRLQIIPMQVPVEPDADSSAIGQRFADGDSR